MRLQRRIAGRLARTTKGFDMKHKIQIPMYQVSLRHPVYGWQVVSTADTATGARVLSGYWVNATSGRCGVNIVRVSKTIPQCWEHVDEYEPAIFGLTSKGGDDESKKG